MPTSYGVCIEDDEFRTIIAMQEVEAFYVDELSDS